METGNVRSRHSKLLKQLEERHGDAFRAEGDAGVHRIGTLAGERADRAVIKIRVPGMESEVAAKRITVR